MRKIVGLIVIAVLVVGFGWVDQSQAASAPQFKWKMQSSHPAGAPQIELLNRMAGDIEKMSAGRLKIEVLATGAIVKPFELIDAVDKGIVETGQFWTHYTMGKHPAGSLFSSPLGGAGSGLDLMNHLSWYLQGGGRDLYLEFYNKILNIGMSIEN